MEYHERVFNPEGWINSLRTAEEKEPAARKFKSHIEEAGHFLDTFFDDIREQKNVSLSIVAPKSKSAKILTQVSSKSVSSK